MTTTTTTTTTTTKPTTLKAVQQILNSQGANDPILPQYFPSNVNRLPVGSDTSMYNGNAYYWPSGYNRLYGTQNVPQTYGRFQPGVQYPYDPRFYNSYDSNGRLIGTNNGYINPVQDYYGKSAPGSKTHASSSQADLGTGIPKGSKPYSGERYFNRKVAPVPQGRDGAPVLSKHVASDQDHILKSTSKPTTVQSTLQSVSTKGSSNKWKSQNQLTDWNQPDQTGWKSSSIKNSKNHFLNDIPSWKSDDKTQDLAPDSQNEWEKTPNSAHNKMDQTNNKLEPNESEQQTSSDSMSSSHSEQNSQPETENQVVPLPHHDAAPQRTWKQHTESNMGNPNLGSETNMQKNEEDAGKGRINEEARVQGNSDSAESQRRKSTINQDGGQSGKLNEEQGWTESTNRGDGQTGTNHKKQNGLESRIQSQGKSRGRSKGRISGAYHRKQGIKDHNQMEDNSGNLHKQKQKAVQQNTDYDNYLNKNPLSGQRKTSGHRKPLHRYDGSRYPFYDSPYSYWNYDYYNYDDNPSKKYPSPINQGDTGTQCCLAVVRSL